VAVALALGTSLTYGLSNYVGPRLARAAPVFLVLIVGQLSALALAALTVAWRGGGVPALGGAGLAVLAGLGNIGGLSFFYLAAAAGPLSLVTPIVATAAAVPVVAGLASGEPLVGTKLTGILLVLGGIAVVSLVPGSTHRSPGGRSAVPRTVGLALCSALTSGMFLTLLEPAAHRCGTYWTVLISRVTLLTGLAALALRDGTAGALRSRAVPGLDLARVAAMAVPGILLFAGTLAYTSATQEGDLSVVSVLSSLYPLVTVALALSLDRERLDRRRWTAVAAALAGVILLSVK
jgi:drug/metabolite transporter (DMT)-like permease